MRKFPLFKTSFFIVAMGFGSVMADVFFSEKLEHYAIEPQTIQQIKSELRKHSPVNKENQLFHGGTEWKLTPTFGWRIENNLCRIKNVVVHLQGIYTLPKMTNRENANPELIAAFDNYYHSLMEHEKGHQALWVEAGEKISQALKSMPPHFQCEQLQRQAKQRVNMLVEQYQEKNKDYDKSTGHGKTQGAYIH